MAAMPLDPYSFLKQGHLSGGLFAWFTKSHCNSCETTKGFPLCAFVSSVIQGLRPAQAYENRFFDLVVQFWLKANG
jgi:hypothetical protein